MVFEFSLSKEEVEDAIRDYAAKANKNFADDLRTSRVKFNIKTRHEGTQREPITINELEGATIIQK